MHAAPKGPEILIGARGSMCSHADGNLTWSLYADKIQLAGGVEAAGFADQQVGGQAW